MRKSKRIFAVASAGGHWVQLLRLRPAFDGCEVVYASTNPGLSGQVEGNAFHSVRDASMWDKLGILVTACQIMWLIVCVRPNVVISTGAAPGFFALMFGRFLGARTIWLDSIANSEELSLAGRKVRRFATHWLTQWPELDTPDGPKYLGSVL